MTKWSVNTFPRLHWIELRVEFKGAHTLILVPFNLYISYLFPSSGVVTRLMCSSIHEDSWFPNNLWLRMLKLGATRERI